MLRGLKILFGVFFCENTLAVFINLIFMVERVKNNAQLGL